MNKKVKATVSCMLIASMAVGSTACSKAAKECKELGTEFIECALDREIEDMIDMCEDEDEATDALSMYASENDAIDALLERATIKPGKVTVKKDEATAAFTIEFPDWDAALDEDPDDVDEFEDILDEIKETVTIEVSIEFEQNKKGKWEVVNPDDFAEDFFEELYDIDFPFSSPLIEHISYTRWYYYDDTTSSGMVIYDSTSDEINLDIGFDDDSYNRQVYYKVYKDGRLVFTSEMGHRMGYFHYYDDNDSSNGYVSSGNYTIEFLDQDGRVIYSDSCIVQ